MRSSVAEETGRTSAINLTNEKSNICEYTTGTLQMKFYARLGRLASKMLWLMP
jgi:hypothetical protein